MGVSITPKEIDDLVRSAEWEVWTTFDKCTVVACKLENGVVLTESSDCVSPDNYDEALGEEICKDKIINKIWEMEGYRLQCEVAGGEKG